jgi:hypothetical protein
MSSASVATKARPRRAGTRELNPILVLHDPLGAGRRDLRAPGQGGAERVRHSKLCGNAIAIYSATIDEAVLGPAVDLILVAGNVVPARAATPPGAVDPIGVAVPCAPGEHGVFVAHPLDPPRPADRAAGNDADDRDHGNSQEHPQGAGHE